MIDLEYMTPVVIAILILIGGHFLINKRESEKRKKNREWIISWQHLENWKKGFRHQPMTVLQEILNPVYQIFNYLVVNLK